MPGVHLDRATADATHKDLCGAASAHLSERDFLAAWRARNSAVVGLLEELPYICPVLVAIGSLVMIGIPLWKDWPQ